MTDLAATSQRLARLGITHATLLVDEARARTNIRAVAERSRADGVVLRPHFKTHQSADVARWFRDEAIDRATVSSLGQAAYFADHGWRDLTLAIGANPLERELVFDLARRIDLGIVVDHPHTVAALAGGPADLRVWLELDVGYGRAGVPHNDLDRLGRLLNAVDAAPGLTAAGLLTHAGHTYGARPDAAAALFHETRQILRATRQHLHRPELLLSAGDTPGFMASDDWSGLDEARPGNFVFFDLMQLEAGACHAHQLACAVACPVIGVYPERRQVVVHAGAVHLSKDTTYAHHGRLLQLKNDGFGELIDDGVVTGLSQEHGTLTFARKQMIDTLVPGDLLLVAPAHSCLTCEQFAVYRTINGGELQRYHRR